MKKQYCKCGCGQLIKHKSWHKYYPSIYINGHYWNGKKQSKEMIKKRIVRGKKHYNYKDGHCLKKYYCINCNKLLRKIKAKRCKKCSDISLERRKKISKNVSLALGGNGVSRRLNNYSIDFTKRLKNKILKRDNYKCRECGLSKEKHYKKYSCNLHIHHIDYNKKNSEETNLITLCLNCHNKTLFDREDWISYFQANT